MSTNTHNLENLKMDKPSKKTPKKSFIRNTVSTKPKTVVIKDSENIVPVSTKPPKKAHSKEAPKKCNTLNEPELNSALKIVKDIETVSNVKLKKSSITDLSNKKHIILEEKASKLVNFPHHQKLYKDLIPLSVNNQPQSLPTITRDYQIIKDEEPVLSNFYTPKKLPEYSFKVSLQSSHKVLNKQFDGFKMYRTMRTWD